MLLRHTFLPGSLALVAGLLGGCGAGEAIFGPETHTLHSPATLDGYVNSAGFVGDNVPVTAIAVGDHGSNAGRRGFVRFSIAGLPAGAEIVSAELRIAQADIAGDPYALGNVLVDHVDIGAGLDALDYNALALLANIGTLSSDAVLTVKTLDVKMEVLADIAAARTTSDFRLRFPLETDSDGLEDSVHFQDMEMNEGLAPSPELVIEYK